MMSRRQGHPLHYPFKAPKKLVHFSSAAWASIGYNHDFPGNDEYLMNIFFVGPTVQRDQLPQTWTNL